MRQLTRIRLADQDRRPLAADDASSGPRLFRPSLLRFLCLKEHHGTHGREGGREQPDYICEEPKSIGSSILVWRNYRPNPSRSRLRSRSAFKALDERTTRPFLGLRPLFLVLEVGLHSFNLLKRKTSAFSVSCLNPCGSGQP